MTGLARKKKQKKFTAVAAIKALARERIGTPPAEQVLPNKKKRRKGTPEKHKETLERLLSEDT